MKMQLSSEIVVQTLVQWNIHSLALSETLKSFNILKHITSKQRDMLEEEEEEKILFKK